MSSFRITILTSAVTNETCDKVTNICDPKHKANRPVKPRCFISADERLTKNKTPKYMTKVPKINVFTLPGATASLRKPAGAAKWSESACTVKEHSIAVGKDPHCA